MVGRMKVEHRWESLIGLDWLACQDHDRYLPYSTSPANNLSVFFIKLRTITYC